MQLIAFCLRNRLLPAEVVTPRSFKLFGPYEKTLSNTGDEKKIEHHISDIRWQVYKRSTSITLNRYAWDEGHANCHCLIKRKGTTFQELSVDNVVGSVSLILLAHWTERVILHLSSSQGIYPSNWISSGIRFTTSRFTTLSHSRRHTVEQNWISEHNSCCGFLRNLS
jgi:hypothetical protein